MCRRAVELACVSRCAAATRSRVGADAVLDVRRAHGCPRGCSRSARRPSPTRGSRRRSSSTIRSRPSSAKPQAVSMRTRLGRDAATARLGRDEVADLPLARLAVELDERREAEECAVEAADQEPGARAVGPALDVARRPVERRSPRAALDGTRVKRRTVVVAGEEVEVVRRGRRDRLERRSRRRRSGADSRRSGAVAALELLARAAPARVVAADVLVLGLDDRLRARRTDRHRRRRPPRRPPPAPPPAAAIASAPASDWCS